MVQLRIDEVVQTADAEITARPEEACVLITRARRGRFRLVGDGQELVRSPGELALMDPHHPYQLRSGPLASQVLRLDLGVVRAAVEDVIGEQPFPSTMLFAQSVPISETRQHYWKRSVDHLVHDILDHDELVKEPLIRAQALRTLGAVTLTTFANTVLGTLAGCRPPRGPERASPVVRRATAFIEANAHRAIGLAEIAGAARIGPRGLQQAFRRNHGHTPIEYLRRVRMDNAHTDLKNADPTAGDTVAAIAARWGFANAGRFSARYRRAYGRFPADTLRQDHR